MRGFSFIEMTAGDLDEYEAVIGPLMDPRDYVTREEFPRLTAEKNFKAWWMREANSQTLIGWCSAADSSTMFPDAVHFYGGAILPAFQKQGLSRFLWAHRLEAYAGRDMSVSIQPCKIQSLNIALGYGFKPVSFKDPWLGMLKRA